MRTIDQRMLGHLYIEYRFGPRFTADKMMVEEHGYISQIDEYIEQLDQWLEKQLDTLQEPGDEKIITIDKPTDVWTSPFFNKCDINFRLGISNSGSYQDGGYQPSRDNSVQIDITVRHINKHFILKKLNTIFAHELTHAYDDYCRKQKGGADMSREMERTGYNKLLDSMDNPDTLNEFALANIFYKLSSMERNALIGMLKTNISQMPLAKTSAEGIKRLKATESWQRVETLKDAVDAINSLNDDSVINDILTTVNKFSNIHFNTFNQFKRVLNRRWESWIKKYMAQASKIVYDVMMSKKPRGLDEGIDWNNEPKLRIYGTTNKKK